MFCILFTANPNSVSKTAHRVLTYKSQCDLLLIMWWKRRSLCKWIRIMHRVVCFASIKVTDVRRPKTCHECRTKDKAIESKVPCTFNSILTFHTFRMVIVEGKKQTKQDANKPIDMSVWTYIYSPVRYKGHSLAVDVPDQAFAANALAGVCRIISDSLIKSSKINFYLALRNNWNGGQWNLTNNCKKLGYVEILAIYIAQHYGIIMKCYIDQKTSVRRNASC